MKIKPIHNMVSNESTYLESVGRLDKQTVIDALEDGGTATVLRVCIGATIETMPLRALGYAASALMIQENYFPNAQLQFVHPLHAAEAANGIEIDRSMPQAKKFEFNRMNIGGGGDNRTTGLFDTPSMDTDLIIAVRNVLERRPIVAEPLLAAAKRRSGDFAAYVASHLVMHDSNPELIRVNPLSSEAKRTERIISIGAQSERIFYLARMSCRQAGVLPDGAIDMTGQLFTRHVLPPYQQCREGEPTLDDYNNRVGLARAFNMQHCVSSVSRDLHFFSSYLRGNLSGSPLLAKSTLS